MRKTLLTLASFCLLGYAGAQTAYYVDGTNGNDANNGTTLTTAWKTIQNSFNKATAGSVVYIKGGTYKNQLTLNVSGTAGNPIEFRNYQTDSVYIDGTGLSANPMISITDQSNVIFRNLIIQNLVKNNAVGIQVVCSGTGAVNNLMFKSLIIRSINWTSNASTKPSSSKNSQPFIAYGEGTTAGNAMHNIVVDSCTIYNNITGFSESLSFGGNIDGITITHNLVHDNTNIGIDVTGNYNECNCNDTAIDHSRNAYIAYNVVYNNVSNYATSSGIYIDGVVNVLVEKNISHHNGSGIELGCEQNGSAYNLIVRDNLIYDNQEPGMAIGGYDITTTGIVNNASITNNTFVANNYANDGTGELDITKVSGCNISNNIFYTNAQNVLFSKEAISPQTNLVLDYNDWYTPNNDSNNINVNWGSASYSDFSTYRTSSGTEKHSFYANPLIVNASITSPDFHITALSPCINRGDPAYVMASNETDFDGNIRIINSLLDIGAYEYKPGTVPVQFVYFNAVKQQEQALLSWATANESNNSYFEIERSVDGKQFNTIGNQLSKGNNNAEQYYSFTDNQIIKGKNYYRLKQKDNTGLIVYTSIAMVDFTTNDLVSVISLANQQQIKVSSKGVVGIAALYNNMGQFIQQFKIASGQNLLAIPNLSSGIYYLQINGKSYKVIVLN